MSKTTIPGLGKKHTLRNLAWLGAAALAVAWIVAHPYPVREALDHLSTFFTVVFGGER